MFIRERPWGQRPWKGREGSRIGQMEKFHCDEGPIIDLADLMESSGANMAGPELTVG